MIPLEFKAITFEDRRPSLVTDEKGIDSNGHYFPFCIDKFEPSFVPGTFATINEDYSLTIKCKSCDDFYIVSPEKKDPIFGVKRTIMKYIAPGRCKNG